MNSPHTPGPLDRDEPGSEAEQGSTLGAFGQMMQGVVLERLTIGVVLVGLVVVAAGLIEGTGIARLAAVVIGLGACALAVTGWRLRWRDARMWAAMLAAGAAELAAFALAVSSGS